MLMFTSVSYAQSIETIANSRPVTMGGNISASDNIEFLSDSVSNYYYIGGGISTKFFGIIDVPISFAFSDNSLTKNMALPFNRFSLNPSYKGYTAYAGFNSMSFSKYTLSGHDYFGGGFGYAGSGAWNVEAFFGRLRKAVVPDSTTTQAGYSRLGGGIKLGYKADKYEVVANMIKIRDRKGSVDFSGFENQYVSPKDNIATSVALKLNLIDNLSLQGEYGLSSMGEFGVSDAELEPGRVLYQAFDAAISYSTSIGSIGVSYDRLPPNYETLGGYYFSEDEEQVAIDIATTIMEKVSVSGNFGYRHDNVDDQQLSTNKSLAYSVNISGNPMERLSLSASVNNNQNYVNLRDNLEQLVKMSEFEDLDTNEYSRLSLSTSFNANYSTQPSEVMTNSFYSSFSLNTTSDEQRYDTASANSKIYNLNLGSNTSFTVPKINVGFNIGLSKTDTRSQAYKMFTLTGTVSKSFESGLSLSAAYTYAGTKTDTISSGVSNLRASASYSLFKKHSIGMSFCYIHNPMSAALPNRYTLSFNYGYGFTLIGDKKKENNKNEE